MSAVHEGGVEVVPIGVQLGADDGVDRGEEHAAALGVATGVQFDHAVCGGALRQCPLVAELLFAGSHTVLVEAVAPESAQPGDVGHRERLGCGDEGVFGGPQVFVFRAGRNRFEHPHDEGRRIGADAVLGQRGRNGGERGSAMTAPVKLRPVEVRSPRRCSFAASPIGTRITSARRPGVEVAPCLALSRSGPSSGREPAADLARGAHPKIVDRTHHAL